MDQNEAIEKALIAHSRCKELLLSAIEAGASELSVEQMQVDNHCEFGAWLYDQAGELRETAKGRNIRKLHASFHVEAARILAMALKGRKDEAAKAVGRQSKFAGLSGQLAMALMQWKQTD